MRCRPFLAVVVLALSLVAGQLAAAPLRAVKLGGEIAHPDVRAHLEFAVGLGFDAVWVPAVEAAAWSRGKPRLRPAFVELVQWCAERDVRLIVAIHPVQGSAEPFRFHERRGEKRIRRLLRLLHRKAGVREFVVSFEGAPTRLTDLRDTLHYGIPAAPAHVDLAARLQARLPAGARLWLQPSISSDRELDDPGSDYAQAFLTTVRSLRPVTGVVWSGPEPVSRRIEPGDLSRISRRLGGRPILLQERYPAGQVAGVVRLSLILGPLRHRSATLLRESAGYVASPMLQLGGSRLALSTIADFLGHPEDYEPETSWRAALARLAGPDEAALDALRTQAIEWGGWVGERNYHTADTDNPTTAARALRDPALFSLWGWTRRRYADRMTALEGLTDIAFRDDLLEIMARRLAVARALPTVRELRARIAAGRDDVAPLLDQLRSERSRAAERPGALLALDRFLMAAGVAELLAGAP